MSIMHKAASAGMWTLGRLLPVQKNKIVISSYYGRGYGDNAKPIVEELLKRTCNLDIVWMVNDDAAAETLPSGVRPVKNTLWNRIRELCTAKIWIDNCRKGARVKKQGQWYLQTWHGFALKRIEKDAAASLPADYPQYAGRDSAQTDLIVSNSALMTKIYNESFWYHGEVLEFGSPRNDVFFVPAEDVKKKCVQHWTYRKTASWCFMRPHSVQTAVWMPIVWIMHAYKRRWQNALAGSGWL